MLETFGRRYLGPVAGAATAGTLGVRRHRVAVPLGHGPTLLPAPVLRGLGLLQQLLSVVLHVVVHVFLRHPVKQIPKLNVCRKVEDTAVRLRLDLVCGKVLLEKVLHGSKLLEEILKVLEEVLEVGGAGPEAGVGVEGVVAHGLVLSAPLWVTQHLVGFRYLPRHNWMRIAKTTLYFTILQLKRYYPVLIYQ